MGKREKIEYGKSENYTFIIVLAQYSAECIYEMILKINQKLSTFDFEPFLFDGLL